MKEAIAILTGGGPAPGMNTVVGSVAKTFLAKGYRVIGLHYGYSVFMPLSVWTRPFWIIATRSSTNWNPVSGTLTAARNIIKPKS